MGEECEEQDYLVSYLSLSSLVLQVVKHRERGEFGETAVIIRLICILASSSKSIQEHPRAAFFNGRTARR